MDTLPRLDRGVLTVKVNILSRRNYRIVKNMIDLFRIRYNYNESLDENDENKMVIKIPYYLGTSADIPKGSDGSSPLDFSTVDVVEMPTLTGSTDPPQPHVGAPLFCLVSFVPRGRFKCQVAMLSAGFWTYGRNYTCMF